VCCKKVFELLDLARKGCTILWFVMLVHFVSPEHSLVYYSAQYSTVLYTPQYRAVARFRRLMDKTPSSNDRFQLGWIA
jgi:hypothetical protein